MTQTSSSEDHQRRALKLETLGALAEGVAHEFNNVLAMILPAAEMISASSDIKTKTAVYAARIVEAANRGANIVKQLSVFTRSDTGEPKPVSLQRIVLEVGALLTHTIRKDIAIRTDITTAHTMVLGEIGMLHQAVLNLAVNAVDAMADGGTLTLEVADAARDDVARLTGLPGTGDEGDPYVVLRVRDTGVGNVEQTREHMFDPLFTAKGLGLSAGLGLSIVGGIVKTHAGYLDVSSTPDAGTTISVYLPVLKQEESADVEDAAAAASSGSGTILVIDDEETIRDMLTEILSINGYSVLTAVDGKDGLRQLRAHHDTISLVISDLGMPRMNGEQFFAAAKKFDPSVKIMITTGYVHTHTRSKLLSLGVVDLVGKPFSIDTLLPAVRRAINMPRPD